MAELVIGETVVTDESLGDHDGLRAFFRVCEERGHDGPAVLVDDLGQVVTHPDYTDHMGAAHLRAGAWAFCRRPTAEALGLPSGTDWIRLHAPHLLFQNGSPYRSKPHFYSQLYLQPFGSRTPHLMQPVCSAQSLAWRNDGTRICLLDERLGRAADQPGAAKYVLWEYELALGTRRRIAGYTAQARLDNVSLCYSSDGMWIHLCEWGSGRNLLIRAIDGLTVELPVQSAAVSWNPRGGASMMTVMTTEQESGDLIVRDYDVSTGILSKRAQLRSPNGIPLNVRELSMSIDERAVVTAPIGVTGMDQLRRGGVYLAAVIDIDDGTIEPVLSAQLRTPGTERRHANPRWCDDWATLRPSPTSVADTLIEHATVPHAEPDSVDLIHDHLERWLEILDGVELAWRTEAMPRSHFASDFAQHAISCLDIDPDRTGEVLNRLATQATQDTVPRVVLSWISSGHRMWSPLPDQHQPEPDTEHQDPMPEDSVSAALDLVIAAEAGRQGAYATRQLITAALDAGHQGEVWAWLAELSSTALTCGRHEFVAKIALATHIWNGFLYPGDPSITHVGLGPTGQTEALSLVLDGFEACAHLPGHHVIGRDQRQVFDAQTLSTWCRQAMTQLPLDEQLRSRARPTRPRRPAPPAPNPTRDQYRSPEGASMAERKVFISYLREDMPTIDRMATELRAAGIDVWIDRTDLTPGLPWKSGIRRAIRDGIYFIVCFSAAYAQRVKTYMNEEIRLAVAELRLMPPDQPWFIQVKLEPCELPEFDIDAVHTSSAYQYIDFTQSWEVGMANLIKTIQS